MLLPDLAFLAAQTARSESPDGLEGWSAAAANPDLADVRLERGPLGQLLHVEVRFAASAAVSLATLAQGFGPWRSLPSMSWEAPLMVAFERLDEPDAPTRVAPFAVLAPATVKAGPESCVAELILRRDLR